jgi:predicted ATPase
VQGYVRDKHLLLVLDNCEQVVEAGPQVRTLLQAAPGLQVLATSRVALRLRGEKRVAVPPLTLPVQEATVLEQLAHVEAVRLFVERARDVDAHFALTADNARAVAEICVRLDGLPLALELAAARVQLLPPETLLPRLARRLGLLTEGPRDVPARQQTLRATIDWSYQLLTPGEQQLFQRLAVFQGGDTLTGLAEVCNFDGQLAVDVTAGMESLLSKSLVQQRADRDRGTVFRNAGNDPRVRAREADGERRSRSVAQAARGLLPGLGRGGRA